MKECPACHRCYQDQVNHCPQDGGLLKFLIHGETTLDGRYLLEQKLGQGGMGMVFKARHVFLKTQHAVKIILPDLVGNDPSLTTRFRQEAMAAAAIRHPNTVSVTDYGVREGTMPFLVMEYIEGRSLHDLLVEQRRLPPRVAVEIMLAVCAGVRAAHEQGIVHRDLKPLNVLIKPGLPPSEGVKVLDFGLAKIKSGELLGSFVAAQTQGMMGSPYYMAPEQWGDDDVDARSDIYSLGVILYQMLAGEVPFRGNSVPAIMKKHLSDAPPSLSALGVDMPLSLMRVVARSLEKEPAGRYQTIEEFSEDLRAALGEQGGGGADVQGVGLRTMPGPFADTGGLEPRGGDGGATTGDQRAEAASLGTNIGGRDGRTTPLETFAEASGSATVAEAPGLVGGAHEDSNAPPLISDTARQRAERTSAGNAGAAESAATTQHIAANPLTDSLSAAALAEQQARARAEEDARERFEAEARARAGEAARGPVAANVAPVFPDRGVAAQVPAPAPSRLPFYVLGGLLALAVVGGIAAVALYMSGAFGGSDVNNSGGNTNANVVVANANTVHGNANAGGQGTEQRTRPDLVSLDGGSFRVGLSDVPPLTEELMNARPTYLLWVYAQWPAHPVRVRPFQLDRTEVTNAEYAEFVKETGHEPPPDVWDGDRPKAGEEKMPVSNVTFEDARAFAEWRSKRDGVAYRLPTEEEWEFAARGGDASRVYPWGASWGEGNANLGTGGPRPVGSFPRGRTVQGVDDMIGNVWEWTSSMATMYRGNNRTALQAADREKVVVRGGAYASRPDGDEPVTATARRWYARDFRDPVLGFRLVRSDR
ncbi:MAG TPA: bifunctional serine/threonine-protein kinase/formylglycine-generating enzyme family protein [Pyrinomonadaceae bacterium]|nr:bifunctional serine/threonine-protein kinase/formylglycine-generating enzyme family protein [Pyrinomonadaceae bacterium]